MATRELVTIENWKEYAAEMTDSGFLEYVFANESIVEKVDEILLKSKTFEELKNELLNLVTERKAFVKFTRKNLP